MIKLGFSDGKIILDYPSRPNVITRVLLSEQGRQRVREGVVARKAEVRGATSQGMWAASRNWKR